MNKNNKLSILPILMFLIIALNSCEAIGAIFKAGVWVGIIVVVIIVIIILWVIKKSSK